MIRSPAVANRFYPGEPKELTTAVTKLLNKYSPNIRRRVSAVVLPHAGYIYSGDTCAKTLKAIDIPSAVIILGPNHHGRGAPISLSMADWNMPMGRVPIHSELAHHILNISNEVVVDEVAHKFEHSLEVQVPFLQVLQEKLSIVPLVLSHLDYHQCKSLATHLAKAIEVYARPVLIIASSDMTHYESRRNATQKDTMVLQELLALNPHGLYHTVTANRISMCGFIPVTVALQAALLLGANSAEIIHYTDSGAVNSDVEQVVGYAGAAVYTL